MIRRRDLPAWQYGVLAGLALTIVLELGLMVFNLRGERVWQGLNNVLVASSCSLLGVSTLYEVERKTHPLAYFAYVLAVLGVASLVIIWVLR